MAVLDSEGLDLRVDAGERMPSACVWSLVSDMYILVFEEAGLGDEFGAELIKAVIALANSQLRFHGNEAL